MALCALARGLYHFASVIRPGPLPPRHRQAFPLNNLFACLTEASCDFTGHAIAREEQVLFVLGRGELALFPKLFS